MNDELENDLMKGETQRAQHVTREESDADSRRVPEMKNPPAPPGSAGQHGQGYQATTRRRGGGSAAEKEHKRLKRLLRNRVSAQQARERKKVYLTDLESRSKDLEDKNAELEEKVATLQRENFMLRQIVKNTALKRPAEETL